MDKFKKLEIQKICNDLIEQSKIQLQGKVLRALNSSAIDIDSWDPNNAPMILPKCIVAAALEDEAEAYKGKGTSYERKIKKEIRNIRYFI